MVPFEPPGQLILVPEMLDVIITLVITTFDVLTVQGPLLMVQRRVAVVPEVKVTVDVGELGVAMVAEPLTTLQAPVPTVGVFAAMVNVVLLQLNIAAPALAVVGFAKFVRTTLSTEVQAPLVMVQARVAEVPTGTPVTPEVLELGVVMVAVPLTTLQAPVPTDGEFPARVKLPLLQLFKSEPALDVVGTALFVNTTVLAEEGQVPLEIVQRSVAVLPAETVTFDVGDEGVVIVAVPLATVQAPVPTIGVLAAIVKADVLHWVIFDPATEVEGVALLVKVTFDEVEQAPFAMVHLTTAAVPTGTPDTDVTAEFGRAMVAEPLTKLQEPTPIKGRLPVAVNKPFSHCEVVVPALAVVPRELFVITTVLLEEGQEPLDIVQRRVAVFPAAKVTAEVAEVEFEMVGEPLTIDQAPTPTDGTFAAITKAAVLH